MNSVNPPPNDPVQPHHLFAHLLTWRPVEQTAFRGDDPHSLEKLRVGQRQLDHLPQTKAALFVHHERISNIKLYYLVSTPFLSKTESLQTKLNHANPKIGVLCDLVAQ